MIQEYKGYKLDLWADKHNLPNAPLALARIYLVTKPGITCAFIFAQGLLARMSSPDISEDDLIATEVEDVKNKIDNQELENGEEYTYWYYGHNFLEQDNATWWTKTLKSQLKTS